jgi:hypothetical protein
MIWEWRPERFRRCVDGLDLRQLNRHQKAKFLGEKFE